MNDLVSIIVPVFNTKINYFKECIDSIKKQTYQNFEVIIINDGSSNELCKQYESLICDDSRFHIYNKKNGGVSSARNYGIKKSKGKYISFVDSDDIINHDLIRTLISCFANDEVDLAICGIKLINNNTLIKDETKTNITILDTNLTYRELLNNKDIGGYLCNKMYKKALIYEFLDESIFYSEDFVFNINYCKKIKKTVYNEKKLYYYRQNFDSSSYNYTYNSKILSLLKANIIIYNVYNKECPSELSKINKLLLKNALNIRARYLYYHVCNKSQKKFIIGIIKQKLFIVLKNNNTIFSEKMKILIMLLFPRLSLFLKKKQIYKNIKE